MVLKSPLWPLMPLCVCSPPPGDRAGKGWSLEAAPVRGHISALHSWPGGQERTTQGICPLPHPEFSGAWGGRLGSRFRLQFTAGHMDWPARGLGEKVCGFVWLPCCPQVGLGEARPQHPKPALYPEQPTFPSPPGLCRCHLSPEEIHGPGPGWGLHPYGLQQLT